MRILLRCDGGGSLGVGHVMRSLALAEAAVAAGHEVVVAGHFEGSLLQRQLAAAPVEVVEIASAAVADPQPLVDLVRRFRPDVVHIDSYADSHADFLADSYEASGQVGEFVAGGLVVSDLVVSGLVLSDLVLSGLVLSNMEDGTFGRRPADVVVDPTFGAELSPRPDDGSTWLLRGSRYTPVRQRVLDARRGDIPVEQVAHREAVRTVLVVMGGTDPVGFAPAAVRLLADTGLALEVTVIAVGGNAERVRAAAQDSGLSMNVLAPVDDLAAIMSGQDLVVSAAGTSASELCCIGVPMALVWVVDNQREGYDRVVAAGAALGLGGPELGGPDLGGDERAVGLLRRALTDSRTRADLVLAGRRIVDGLGAWRVVRTWEVAQRQKLRQEPDTSHSHRRVADAYLVARPATLEDSRQLWAWRNDPGTRAGSRHPGVVPWVEHRAWLQSSLARDDRVLLVVEDPDCTAGTVRWDLRGEGEWEVSITVAPDRRGRSLARPLLRAAELALSEVARSRGTDVTAYLAVVHVDNHASVRLFETSAYLPDLPPDPQGFMSFRKAARVA